MTSSYTAVDAIVPGGPAEEWRVLVNTALKQAIANERSKQWIKVLSSTFSRNTLHITLMFQTKIVFATFFRTGWPTSGILVDVTPRLWNRLWNVVSTAIHWGQSAKLVLGYRPPWPPSNLRWNHKFVTHTYLHAPQMSTSAISGKCCTLPNDD